MNKPDVRIHLEAAVQFARNAGYGVTKIRQRLQTIEADPSLRHRRMKAEEAIRDGHEFVTIGADKATDQIGRYDRAMQHAGLNPMTSARQAAIDEAETLIQQWRRELDDLQADMPDYPIEP